MAFRKSLIYCSILLMVLFSNIIVAGDTATETMRTTIDEILATLADETLETQTKKEKIKAVVAKRFDYRAMSQRTLSVNWRKSSKAQQDRFVQLFSELLQHSYLSRIEAYTDEKVTYAGEKVKGNKAIVETFIVTASVDIPINYKLYSKNGDWLVYDIVIEEVSLVRSYNSSYRSVVKNSGIDGLLAEMESQLNEMSNNKSAPGETS